jgi:hypothetical protein
MSEQNALISETTMGYDVFAPLWALVVQGSTADAGLVAFMASRRPDLDQLLSVVRHIGNFSEATMMIFEEQGVWRHGRDLTTDEIAMDLVMSAGFVEEYPPRLDDPAVLRRLLDLGRHLQLTNLLNALVSAAMGGGPGVEPAAPLIDEALRRAARLAGVDPGRAVEAAFRSWCVAMVPGVLRPDSVTPAPARAELRRYLHLLEGLLVPA